MISTAMLQEIPEPGDDGGLSAIELLDRTIASLPPGDATRRDLLTLRISVAEQEETMAEARQVIEKLEGIVKKVTSPANRIGTFLVAANKETAQVVCGGSDYFCNIDPRVNILRLKKGTRVLL